MTREIFSVFYEDIVFVRLIIAVIEKRREYSQDM